MTGTAPELVTELFVIAMLPLVAWGTLVAMRGDFWRADQRLIEGEFTPDRYPPVAVVIPARNEADVVRRAVASVLGQEYGGQVTVAVVDDRSDDATAAEARAAGDVEVIAGSRTPSGWTGKLWAVSQGIDSALAEAPDAEFVWITDADIEHDPGELASLIAMGDSHDLDLISLMVKLRLETFWDRLLIPAFVFFFQKLYPFPWVNDPDRDTAAAAGGSMLVRRSALGRIGGIAAIRGELIDDCALAARIKGSGGRIHLALAEHTRSLRGYRTLGAIWRMVARSAFHQLRYSPLLLAGTVVGMVVLYVLPPAIFCIGLATGELPAAFAGFATWFLMGWVFAPTLYRYGLSPYRSFLLPLAGVLYTLMTVDSARRHWQGRGGEWKGRVHRP